MEQRTDDAFAAAVETGLRAARAKDGAVPPDAAMWTGAIGDDGMTCVIGLVHKGTVYMGADSAATAGWLMISRRNPKVYRNGPMLIGCAGSPRMKDLLRFRFAVPPHHPPDKDDLTYMATDFIDAVRQCFKDYGYAKVENQQESGGTFLVGYRGALYEVYGDFQVGVSDVPYAAIGCGNEVALGAMYVASSQKAFDPKAAIQSALTAAETFMTGVRRPFVIEALEPVARTAANNG